jgi:hypothetical protein
MTGVEGHKSTGTFSASSFFVVESHLSSCIIKVIYIHPYSTTSPNSIGGTDCVARRPHASLSEFMARGNVRPRALNESCTHVPRTCRPSCDFPFKYFR